MAANDFIVRDDECSKLWGYLALSSSHLKINFKQVAGIRNPLCLWVSAALPLGFEDVGRVAEGGREPPENFYCPRVCVAVANVLKRPHNRLSKWVFRSGDGSPFGNGGKGKKGASLHLVILPVD